MKKKKGDQKRAQKARDEKKKKIKVSWKIIQKYALL